VANKTNNKKAPLPKSWLLVLFVIACLVGAFIYSVAPKSEVWGKEGFDLSSFLIALAGFVAFIVVGVITNEIHRQYVQRKEPDSNSSVSEELKRIKELLVADGRNGTPADIDEIQNALQRAKSAEEERDNIKTENIQLKAQLTQATLSVPPQPTKADSNLRFLSLKYFQIAYDLAIKGKYSEALPYMDLTIELDPDDAKAYSNRGIVKSYLGRNEEALKDYDEAIKLDPNLAQAYYNRGIVKSELGRNEEALKDYDEAIKLDPKLTKAYYNRGNVNSKLYRKKEALKDYDEAIKLDPNLAKAYSNRGNVKNELGHNEEALKGYDKAIELDPNDAKAYYNRGVVKNELGRNEEALKDYHEAIKLDPNLAQAYYNRACLFALNGDLGSMERDLRQAISLDPSYRASAPADPDFKNVLTTPEFLRAIGNP
jgi:tetratricopeptide (TPR) repeat protein